MRRFTMAMAWVLGIALMAGETMAADDGLIGYWPLAGDCRDHSGHELHGIAHGVSFDAKGPGGQAGRAARFDGRDDWIEVKTRVSPALGTRDFSIAAWVHTEENLDDALGDVVSKYDRRRRRGLNLSIKIHQGVTSTQSNYRNLEFGIDAGTEPRFADCGRPGENIFVCALAVYAGDLYAGTFETGEDKTGHVYRYAGGTKWLDLGSPDQANAVFCLCEFQGKLYCGTAAYRARGSALPDSPNMRPGGHVYRYEGEKRWVDCGQLGDAGEVYAMAVFRGKLYAIPMYSPGVYEYDGRDKWTYIGTPGENRCMTIATWNGDLYSTGNGGAGVWRWGGGTKWVDCGKQAEETQTYSTLIYRGRFYTGTWPSGSVFRYDGGTTWTSVGQLGEEKEVMAVGVYNGQFYAGTLPRAQIYRFDGENDWTCVGRVDHTPDVTYRRAWSMAAYRGKLYVGTLPSGHVWAMEAGKAVNHDHSLRPGWRHVVAVRDGNRLKLYVDGACVARSEPFDPAAFDLSNDEPLRIGFGEHDYFNGSLAEVRLYDRALEEAEVAKLGKRR